MPDAIIKRLESSPTRLSPLRIRAQPTRPTGVRIRNAPKARDTPEDAWLAAEVSVFTQLVNALEDAEEGEPTVWSARRVARTPLDTSAHRCDYPAPLPYAPPSPRPGDR